MIFNKHYNLKGKHATLSASKYHWINYTPEKMEQIIRNEAAKALGTRMHDFAAEAIEMGIKLPSRTKKTLNLYVNDAIGYRMTPEQVLRYSDRVFGTADAISFNGKLLRIHDLKTGVTPASLHQLEIYAALFCLEYDVKPGSIDMELRIYQNDEVLVSVPEVADIIHIMDRIVAYDKLIEQIQNEGV